jgi:RND family efflux transporter MFP subunit
MRSSLLALAVAAALGTPLRAQVPVRGHDSVRGQEHVSGQEPVRGIVRAMEDAWLSSELNARMTAVHRREGEAFSRGDVLIAFDCAKQASELDAARAEEAINRIVYENSVELDKRKAIGRFEVAQNQARLDKARAQTALLERRMRDCAIVAPFDGRVAELKARAHETSAPNQPLMRLVSGTGLEIEMIAPSAWLRWLQPGQAVQVRIDETGTLHGAVVQRIAPVVDPVSQTVKVLASFREDSGRVLPGMSFTAEFDSPMR